MTDRINALTVVLDRDVREDDVRQLIDAICQFRLVLRVDPNVADVADFIAHSRAYSSISQSLWDALNAVKP